MATIQRNVKTFGTRSFVGEVAAAPSNYAPILSNEVDADLDTVYAAWNGGTDSVNLKDGSVTFAKLAPDAQLWRDTGTTLTPGANFTSRPVAAAPIAQAYQWGQTATPFKHRLMDAAQELWMTVNAKDTAAVDDATKPQWLHATSLGNDNYTIHRSPAGATASWAQLLRLGNGGDARRNG